MNPASENVNDEGARRPIIARAGKPSQFKLRHRLLLLTAVAVLPAFAIVISNHVSSYALRSAEVDAYVMETTDIVRNEMLRGLTGAATLMLAMGRAATVEEHDPVACQSYAEDLQQDLPTVLDVAVADETGAVYCHSGVSPMGELQSSVDALVEADQPDVVVGNYTATPDGATLPLGMALRNPEGVIEGYIQLHVNMAELVRLVTAATENVQDSTTIVTDRNGTVLLSLPRDLVEPGEPIPERYASLITADAPGATRLANAQGVSQIVGYRPAVERVPVATVFAAPEAPMMAPINRAALTNSMIALTGATLAFVLAWFIGATSIQRPISILNSTLVARKSGDQEVRTGLAKDRSELGEIAQAVDGLFDELDRRDEVQRQTEEQRDLYAREVQHRVKNLLAIIQVIAKQSLARPDASPEILAFERRIDAVIRTNSKLLARNDHVAGVDELVHDAVAPFVGESSDRVEIEGPSITLRAKVATSLAMALHELATNAVKYGALSAAQGKVHVHWVVEDANFTMTWTERGGPPVSSPVEGGFGSVMISRVLKAETGGEVTTTYDEEGFSFRLAAPLSHLEANSEVNTQADLRHAQ